MCNILLLFSYSEVAISFCHLSIRTGNYIKNAFVAIFVLYVDPNIIPSTKLRTYFSICVCKCNESIILFGRISYGKT